MLDSYHEQAGILFPREWIQIEIRKHKLFSLSLSALKEVIKNTLGFLRSLEKEFFFKEIFNLPDPEHFGLKFLVPQYRWKDELYEEMIEKELGSIEITKVTACFH